MTRRRLLYFRLRLAYVRMCIGFYRTVGLTDGAYAYVQGELDLLDIELAEAEA